jgi:hypothetical protein
MKFSRPYKKETLADALPVRCIRFLPNPFLSVLAVYIPPYLNTVYLPIPTHVLISIKLITFCYNEDVSEYFILAMVL